MEPADDRRRQSGGVPLDLVLLLAVALPLAVLAIWLTWVTGGVYWLLGIGAFIIALWFVTLPTRRRRRVDADGRHRQVGHDHSWTDGREDEE